MLGWQLGSVAGARPLAPGVCQLFCASPPPESLLGWRPRGQPRVSDSVGPGRGGGGRPEDQHSKWQGEVPDTGGRCCPRSDPVLG